MNPVMVNESALSENALVTLILMVICMDSKFAVKQIKNKTNQINVKT